MKSILTALLLLAASAAQASTITIEFDVTVVANECQTYRSYSAPQCTLTFDGLEVGETYLGVITIENAVKNDNIDLLIDPLLQPGQTMDLSQSFGFYNVDADWTCQIGGLDCHRLGRREVLQGYFDYSSGEGYFQLSDSLRSFGESFGIGGEISLSDDQGGLDWQYFSAVSSVAKSPVPTNLNAVPLPASGFFLTAWLVAVAFGRQRARV